MKLNKDNLVIGITGGVGSGKSTVLDALRGRAAIYQADKVQLGLTVPGGPAYDAVTALFGRECILRDGSLDRGYIAGRMFADPGLVESMNAIIHPAVRAFFEEKARHETGVIVFEAALPIGGGFPELCDEIWYIYVKREERIRRLMASRGYTRKKCLDIMANQMGDRQFRAIADRVIDNNGLPPRTARAALDALAAAGAGRFARSEKENR